jgi:hypothetical protein
MFGSYTRMWCYVQYALNFKELSSILKLSSHTLLGLQDRLFKVFQLLFYTPDKSNICYKFGFLL